MGCVVCTSSQSTGTANSSSNQHHHHHERRPSHGEYLTEHSRAPSHAEKATASPLPNPIHPTLSSFAAGTGPSSSSSSSEITEGGRCAETELTQPHHVAAARRHHHHNNHPKANGKAQGHSVSLQQSSNGDGAQQRERGSHPHRTSAPYAAAAAPASMASAGATSNSVYASRQSKLSLHSSPFPLSLTEQRVLSFSGGGSTAMGRTLSTSVPASARCTSASDSYGARAAHGGRPQLPQYNTLHPIAVPAHPLHHRLSLTASTSNNCHAMRESLLSDISATLSTISVTANSVPEVVTPTHGGGPGGRNSIKAGMFRNGDDLEAQRQQAPLSIEEDLFIYDDIVISKDEARTKHWRLAGRKPPAALEGGSALDGSVGSGSSGRSSSLKGKNYFTFNDFDVCVDEMDWMPATTGAASSIAPLQQGVETASSPTTDFKSMRTTSTIATVPNTVTYLEAQARLTAARANRLLRGFGAQSVLGHATRVKCIALSPAETDFASCSNEDASISLNNLKVGGEVGIFTGHQDTIINAAFSPDGKYLATTSKDKTMILWDVMTTKNLLTFSHPKVVICCGFGPDSKYLVSGCQDRICRLWDTKRGKEWLSYTGHEGIIIAIAFSPDGSYVCSASADKSLRVWSATTAKTRFHLTRHTGIILSCSYTADGRHIISNDESLLCVWSTEDGSCTLALSPADVAGTALLSARGPKLGWTLSSAAPGAFTGYVLVACNNRFVYVLDIKTGEEVTRAFCKAPVYCLTAGSYEKMACGDSFGNIYILRLT